MESISSERWLPVVGWEGLYEVSDLGRVRSLPRQGVATVPGGRMIKSGLTGDGHVRVHLYRNSQEKTRLLHQLVLEAFVGLRPIGQEVRHGPGGPRDNRLVNLCYGTHRENMADQLRDGTRAVGEAHGNAKLTWAIVTECRRRHSTGEAQRALAREFGVTYQTMSSALHGRTWRLEVMPS